MRKSLRVFAGIAFLIGTTGGSQLADANLIVNGDFEAEPFVDTGGGYDRLLVGDTSMPGWTVVQNEIVRAGPSNQDGFHGTDGPYCLDLTSYGRVNPPGGVAQTVPTVAGREYRISMDLSALDAPVSVQVDLGPASVTLAQSQTGLVWARRGAEFVAQGSSTPVTIAGLTGGFIIGLDNVRMMLAGDANEDGRVDADDFTLIDRGFADHLVGWSNGDFDESGVIDAADYQIIDSAYAWEVAHAPGAVIASGVPEPGTSAVAAILMAMTVVVRPRGRRVTWPTRARA